MKKRIFSTLIILLILSIIIFFYVLYSRITYSNLNSNNNEKVEILLVLDTSESPWNGENQLIKKNIKSFFDVLKKYDSFKAGIFTANDDINKYNLTSNKEYWQKWCNSDVFKCKDVKFSKFYKAIYEGIEVVGENGIIIAVSDWKTRQDEPQLDYDIGMIIMQSKSSNVKIFPICMSNVIDSTDLFALQSELNTMIYNKIGNDPRILYQNIIGQIEKLSFNNPNNSNGSKLTLRKFFEFIFFSLTFWIIVTLIILSFLIILYYKTDAKDEDDATDDFEIVLSDGKDKFIIEKKGIYNIGRGEKNDIIIGEHLFKNDNGTALYSDLHNAPVTRFVSNHHGKLEWNGKDLILSPKENAKNKMYVTETINDKPDPDKDKISGESQIKNNNTIWLVWFDSDKGNKSAIKTPLKVEVKIIPKGTLIGTRTLVG